jgi:hypothetical protein
MAGLNYRTGKVASAHHSKFPFRSDGSFSETILTGGVSHIGENGIGDCSSAFRPCYLGSLFMKPVSAIFHEPQIWNFGQYHSFLDV